MYLKHNQSIPEYRRYQLGIHTLFSTRSPVSQPPFLTHFEVNRSSISEIRAKITSNALVSFWKCITCILSAILAELKTDSFCILVTVCILFSFFFLLRRVS